MIIAAAVTAVLAPGTLRLKLRTDGHALVPVGNKAIQLDRSIREEFGTEDPIVVLIRSDHPEGIFNAKTIALVNTLTEAFKRIEGVRSADVFSLATEHGHRVRPGTLHFRTFLEPLPRTRQELDTLRDDLRIIELYTGTLVSYDGTATSVLVGTPHGMDRIELCKTIEDIIADQGDIPEKTHVIGAPIAEALLGTHLLQDLGVPAAWLGYQARGGGKAEGWQWPETFQQFRTFIGVHIGLVPIALAVMAIVFLVSFRSVAATALPLAEVGACLVSVFGLMGWLDVPIYLTIAVLPVILTAMGVADEIHIFARYRELLRGATAEDRGHVDVVRATMDEMWIPVVKTSVTTAVGFLSFALSPLNPVRAFGIFTAIGIVFCMLWSMTVIPAMLTVIPSRWFMRREDSPSTDLAGIGTAAQLRDTGFTTGQNATPTLGTRLFSWIGGTVLRHRFVAVGVAVLAVIAAPYGVKRIVVQDSWIDGFAPDSEFYQATQLFNEQFLGTHLLLVCVDGGGEVLSGDLEHASLDGSDIKLPADRLPADLVDHPERLIEQQFVLNVSGRPKVVTRSPERVQARDTWISRVEKARFDGEHVIVSTSRKHGWPKPMLRLTGQETLRYAITPQPLTQPGNLHLISKFEDFIEAHRDQAVGGVIGTADYIETTNFISQGRKPESRSIPDTPDRMNWLWSQYQRIRGMDRRRQVIDTDYSRSLITIFMKNANFVDTQKLMDDIREYERTNLAPHGITLEFAGDVAVSQTVIDAIVSTQTRSLLASLVGIFAVTMLLSRSVVWGLLCVLPCALAVLVNFAIMGWVGMPLGVATSMFAGMTLGIGVDYAIHVLERYRLARTRGLVGDEAVADAVTATGPAILIDALAVALGFGILMLSQVPANARLGGLVMLSIINCFAATLILLPALLRIGARRSVVGAPLVGSDAGPESLTRQRQ